MNGSSLFDPLCAVLRPSFRLRVCGQITGPADSLMVFPAS